MSATAGRGPTMRDDETGTTGGTTTPPDTSLPVPADRGVDGETATHVPSASTAAAHVTSARTTTTHLVSKPATATHVPSEPATATHIVSEHDVRLALTALELEDRALTVHRATAFLTALGVTVTHAPLPATPWSADVAATTPEEADSLRPASSPTSTSTLVRPASSPATSTAPRARPALSPA